MAIPQDTRSPFQQLRLLEVKNIGDSTVPAFAAIEIVDVELPEVGSELTPGGGRVVIKVRKPTCDSSPKIIFNLMTPIEPNKFGVATNEFPCWALCGTTSNGKRVGSREDSYSLEEHQSGFIVDGGSWGQATRIRRPSNEVELYEGTLYEALCSGSGLSNDLTKVGSCCDEEEITGTVTLENKYNFKACAGDPFLAIRICSDGEPTYRLIVVKHQTANVAISGQYYDECSLRFPKRSMAVMHCCGDVDEDVITMHEHTYLADVKINKTGGGYGSGGSAGGSQVCELQLQSSVGRICGFDPYAPDELTDIYSPITFSPVQVVMDLTDDTACLQKTRQWVYVLCWDDPDTPEDVLCLDPCEEGTGTGSA